MPPQGYFVKFGKNITGPVNEERLLPLWKAGKLPEHAAVSLDKVNWTNIKAFLGLYDQEPEEVKAAEVLEEDLDERPRRKKPKEKVPSGLTPDITFTLKLLGSGDLIKNSLATTVVIGSIVMGSGAFLGCIVMVGGGFVDSKISLIFTGLFMMYPIYLCMGIGWSVGGEIRNARPSNFPVASIISIILDGIAGVSFLLLLFFSVPAMFVAIEYYPWPMNALVAVCSFPAYIICAFVSLIAIKWFKEFTMVIFSIGENVDLIREAKVRKPIS